VTEDDDVHMKEVSGTNCLSSGHRKETGPIDVPSSPEPCGFPSTAIAAGAVARPSMIIAVSMVKL